MGGEVEEERLLSDTEEGRSLSIKPVLLTSTSRAGTAYALEMENRHKRLLKFIHKVPPAVSSALGHIQRRHSGFGPLESLCPFWRGTVGCWGAS